MTSITILPADSFVVINNSLLNDNDRRLLVMLYQPIIGYDAIGLYFTLWSYLDKAEIMSLEWTHHHLMSSMRLKLDRILIAREKLEAIGLIKTYLKKGNINSYVYELYAPASAKDFFNNPLLSVTLYNNVGKKEYEKISTYFKKTPINLREYEDVTSLFSDVFDSVSLEYNYVFNEDLKARNKNDINIENCLDFNLIIESLIPYINNTKIFTKEMRSFISKLAFIYKLDELQMIDIIRGSLNSKGGIDKDRLRVTCRNFYQFEHNGKLPSLIYRTQPDYLRKPIGDNSNRARMIYTFETTCPSDYLASKYKSGNPSKTDLKLIEELMIDLDIKPGVMNVLIDYVLKINNQKLTRSFVETIAGQWKRLNIETVEEAMNIAEKEHKKRVKIAGKTTNKTSYKENTPEWFGKNIEKEIASIEEQQEMEELLKEFR